jgi:hypothetical protein
MLSRPVLSIAQRIERPDDDLGRAVGGTPQDDGSHEGNVPARLPVLALHPEHVTQAGSDVGIPRWPTYDAARDPSICCYPSGPASPSSTGHAPLGHSISRIVVGNPRYRRLGQIRKAGAVWVCRAGLEVAAHASLINDRLPKVQHEVRNIVSLECIVIISISIDNKV